MEAHETLPSEQSTSQRVKRSMLSMLIGRPISALGGLLVLVLLSRLLTKEDYGAYFALWAMVEISILVSDPGVLHLIYRFVSASSNAKGQVMPKGPALQLLLIRCIALAICAGLLLIVPFHWLALLKLDTSPQLLKAAAIILFFEGTARAIEAIFDTMLCQGASQISTVARTLMRLLGIYFCFTTSASLTLDLLIKVDIFATAVGAMLGVILIVHIYIGRKSYEGKYIAPNIVPPRTLFYYAWPAYISQALGILFGADMLKLTLTGSNGVAELAIFGYVFSLTAVIQRYLPANLLAGIFRPLFVSAAKKKEDADKVLVELLIACIKINWIFILPMACFSFILGDFILTKISSGNYQHVGTVLTASIFGLMAFSTHLTLSHLCLAKQTPWPLLGANLCATLGLLIGIYLGAHYGALGTAIAFGINETIWCLASFYFLFRNSPFIRYADIIGILRLILVGVATIIAASLFKYLFAIEPILIAIFLALPLAFGVCRCGVFSSQEGKWLMAVLPLGHKLPLVLKFRSVSAAA